jgi:hypothetical protein
VNAQRYERRLVRLRALLLLPGGPAPSTVIAEECKLILKAKYDRAAHILEAAFAEAEAVQERTGDGACEPL